MVAMFREVPDKNKKEIGEGPIHILQRWRTEEKNALLAGRKEEANAQNDRIRLAGLKLYTNEPPGAHGHRKSRG